MCWGDNSWGQINTPALAPGLHYTSLSVGAGSNIAQVSDGSVRLWGSNLYGQLNIPTLPPGVTWQQLSAGFGHCLGLRSDGQAEAWGYNGFGACNVPALPSGLTFTTVAAVGYHSLAMRSDGVLLAWGYNSDGQCNVPPPPPGTHYVQFDGGYLHSVALRSDGEVVCWGDNSAHQGDVSALLPGTSYLRIDAGYETSGGLVGRESTYISFAPGCPGSLGASHLVPRDTPQIGKTFTVQVDHLPANVAFLGFGWNGLPGGVPLDSIGMTGCTAWITFDALLPVIGSGGAATWDLSLPYLPLLMGTHFYNQAVVLDPSGPNPLGLTMSDAACGVIGG